MLEIARKPFEVTEKAIRAHAFSSKQLKDYPEWLEALLTVKQAAARANAGAGLLDETEEQTLRQACESLKRPEYRDLFQADVYQGGGGIAVHTNINEAIAVMAQELGHPLQIETQINLSQSTSDVLSTASAVAILKTGEELLGILESTKKILREKAKEANGIRTMARTCLRDALPAPIAQLFEGYSLLVQRQQEELLRYLEALENVNLGGTVIGSGEGATLTYQGLVIPFLSELSQLPLKRSENLFDLAQNIDRFSKVSSALAEIATSWIKITKDLRLMASGPVTGFNELSLPEAIPGSSFFPGKVNPTLPETVLQACFLVLGNHRTVQSSCEHGELFLNVFESCAALKTYESIAILSESISKMNQFCLEKLTINADICEGWVKLWEKHQNA